MLRLSSFGEQRAFSPLAATYTARREGLLIKWASAVEDVVNGLFGWRPCSDV